MTVPTVGPVAWRHLPTAQDHRDWWPSGSPAASQSRQTKSVRPIELCWPCNSTGTSLPNSAWRCSTHCRRRAGLSNFPQAPLSRSAPTSDPRSPSGDGFSFSRSFRRSWSVGEDIRASDSNSAPISQRSLRLGQRTGPRQFGHLGVQAYMLITSRSWRSAAALILRGAKCAAIRNQTWTRF